MLKARVTKAKSKLTVRMLARQLASVVLVAGLAFTAQAADTIKIGAVAPKTGPLAGCATVTQWPNV